jgi:hypothetical protein
VLITTLAAAAIALLAYPAAAQSPSPPLAQPINAPYVGEDATGKHVVALWAFDQQTPEADLSGNGHALTLKGGAYGPDGRFGGGLVSGRGWPVEDKPHAALARNHPALSPPGAFSLELWLKAADELVGYPESFLVDKKYVDNTDYQLTLSAAQADGRRQLTVRLGFGDATDTLNSSYFPLEPGRWRHIAFTYDGAGTGRFFVDGADMGVTKLPGRAGIVPGKKDLSIGDRLGSYYHGFPGVIDQVRLCNQALEFRPSGVELTSLRRVFVRQEQPAALTFDVVNRRSTSLNGATARVSVGASAPQVFPLPEIGPGGRWPLQVPLDTSLRPDEYVVAATVQTADDPPFSSTQSFTVTIVPRPVPHRMPVLMWGAGLNEIERLKDIGFTHVIGVPADMDAIWNAGKPTSPRKPEDIASTWADLDRALANGITACASLSPGSYARSKTEFNRIGRDGKPYTKVDVCGQFPQVREFCYNVGASMAQAYGAHPAFGCALIHTEVRGDSQLCFHPQDREAYRKATGLEIPDLPKDKNGVAYAGVPGFPADRVIPDDDPIYRYYRWFWSQGDGWNALTSAVDEGLKSTGRKDFWTFHDPAVRVATAYGSGGSVDFLSHWTYSYPDPIRIGLCTDELFCMAGGATRPDQRVMKMTQIIWYRSQTAPEPGEQAQAQTGLFNDQDTRPRGTGSVDTSGRYLAAWERAIPDARFITIAPMHLREAFWSKVSRPIQGIMYHGWQSLVDCEKAHTSYRYTHPETKNELRRLVREVVEPLGPSLVQIPDRTADVAFLESLASQMYTRKGTYGWNGGWAGDAYEILTYAGLQPRVVYDETIQKEGLDGIKILVTVDCDVLPRSVVDKIVAFQQAGGIVIGDQNLCPAVKADITLTSRDRPKEADKARALLIAEATALRQQLEGRYVWPARSSTCDVTTRLRRYGSTDYLFAVNDLREFGDYVGHHGLVMENGLPTDATLTIHRPDGFVYDLRAHRQIAAASANGALTIQAHFEPCDGHLYMVTDHAISDVRVSAPGAAKPGDALDLRASVVDDAGQPIDAVIPVRVDITDPDGRPAEFSGFYGAVGGQVSISAQLAANDLAGLWQVRVEELASGRTGYAYIRVGGGK